MNALRQDADGPALQVGLCLKLLHSFANNALQHFAACVFCGLVKPRVGVAAASLCQGGFVRLACAFAAGRGERPADDILQLLAHQRLGDHGLLVILPDVHDLLGLRDVHEPILLRREDCKHAAGLLESGAEALGEVRGDGVCAVIPLGGARADIGRERFVKGEQIALHPSHKFVAFYDGILLASDVLRQVRIVNIRHLLGQQFSRHHFAVDV